MSFLESIPNELVAHTIAICGARGEQWLDSLPTLIDELEREWSISVGSPFPAIEFNYVAEALDSAGQLAVIKISPPFDNPENLSEAKFLRVANGRCTVKLLAEDRTRRSILIERAVPGRSLVELFTGNEFASIDPAITVLEAITHMPPEDITDTIDLDDWFDGLRSSAESGFPMIHAAKALEIYSELSSSKVPRYYLHGDFHPANVVSATREPYLAIDPKGIIGPIGYDVAVFLNNFHWWLEGQIDVHDRLDVAIETFSRSLDLDPYELRQWAFCQMVLGAWWTFDEMPQIYQNEVVKADIWKV